jgi:hypothetical protein
VTPHRRGRLGLPIGLALAMMMADFAADSIADVCTIS